MNEFKSWNSYSLGGARPKAMIHHGDAKMIAKFSSSTDTYNVVKAEYVAMRLAARAGLDVAPVSLEHVAGKDVLLVERFDRVKTNDGWTRKAMVSALTLFGLDEIMARYASYEDLVEFAGTAAVEGRRPDRLAAKIGPTENPGDAVSLRLESRRARASTGCHGPGGQTVP